jgi:G3E family GTPase
MRKAPIPFTVISGFLGAGKTTLLNRILNDPKGRRFAVLVNDFGSVNIDEKLIVGHDGSTMSLSNGCICCSIAEGLVGALLRVFDQDPLPEHIVVEASGVAFPQKIADVARIDPMLSLDGVFVVLDTEQIRAQAADKYLADTVAAQIGAADILILNKTDLMDEASIAAIRRWLDDLFGEKPILKTVNCDIPFEALVGARGNGAEGDAPAVSSQPSQHRLQSWTFEATGVFDKERLAAVLAALPSAVVRAKGLMNVQGDVAPLLYQRVGGRWTLTQPRGLDVDCKGAKLVFLSTPDFTDFDGLNRTLLECLASD